MTLKEGVKVVVKGVWKKPYRGVVKGTSKNWPLVHFPDDKSQLLINPKYITVIKEKTPKQASGRWTKEEHTQFLDGIKSYGRDWKKVATVVATRSVQQCRSHAQKHFQKENKKRKRDDAQKHFQKEDKRQCDESVIEAAKLLFSLASKTQETAALILKQLENR